MKDSADHFIDAGGEQDADNGYFWMNHVAQELRVENEAKH
jgi:hypothetical protein